MKGGSDHSLEDELERPTARSVWIFNIQESILLWKEMKTNKVEGAKVIYSELAMQGSQSDTVTCIWSETQWQAEWKKEEGFRCVLIATVGMGSSRQTN